MAMASELVESRVFVVGCPRSGTTLLQSTLAGHPLIQTFPETQFFTWAFRRNWLKRALMWPAWAVRGRLESFVRELNREDLVPLAHVGLFQRDYYRPFIEVLDLLTLEAKREIWVEKTPRHLEFIDEIRRCVPRARFIHIIRDGQDVVASLYEVTRKYPKVWHGALTIDQCIRYWNKAISVSAAWAGHPDHYMVRYENLVKNLEAVDKALCSFLKIAYDQGMLDYVQAFGRIVRSKETGWKKGILGSLEVSNSKFESIFTAREQEYILGHLLDLDVLGIFEENGR
jgi:hypothetical protein